VECPRQGGRIAGDIEDYRMGIICDGRCPNNMESGAIVDYYHHKFQYVDQYKHSAVVVGLELECTLNHFVRETNVPPDSQGDGKSSSAFQRTISDCCCKGRSRD
jgi:hypothetical protein